MDKFDVLKKYGLKDDADSKINIKMKGHVGAKDLVTEFKIYEEFLNKKWVELRNKKQELMKNRVCDKLKIDTDLAHKQCSYCLYINNTLCKDCEFYINEIRELEESMEELNKAGEEFSEAANKEYWNN